MRISRRRFLSSVGAAGAAAFLGPRLLGTEGADQAAPPGIDAVADLQVLWREAGAFADLPVLASNGKDVVLAVWLARLADDKELVMAREYRGAWSKPVSIAPQPARYESPCLVHGVNTDAMAVWIRLDGAQRTLQCGTYTDGKFGAPKDISVSRGRASNPALAAGSDGSYWLAWEDYSNGVFRICLTGCVGGWWGRAVGITGGKGNAYDPAVAVDGSGIVWVAYSAAENGERNVYLTSYDPRSGKRGDVVPVAVGGEVSAGPMVNSQPSLWIDGVNRVWIAYQRYGKSRKTISSHGNSDCAVVCHRDGQLYELAPQSPDHGGRLVFSGQNDQFPVILPDGSGRPWAFTRRSLEARRAWNVRAALLDGGAGWSPPASPLVETEFGRLARPAVAFAGGSFWVAWQADDYLARRTDPAVTSEIRAARVKVAAPTGAAKPLIFDNASPGQQNPNRAGKPKTDRRALDAGGEKLTLLFGNLHEHTSISRCWADGSDGTLDDNYRHGIEVENYDFMALTDHGYDLYEAAWRASRRAAEFYNDPPHFVTFPAYEWTFSGPDKPAGSGHRNVIFESEEDAARFIWQNKVVYDRHLPVSNHVNKLWSLLRESGIRAITIPHHPADRAHPMDWDFHDPEYQRVVEIFQCRGSSEHADCPRVIRNLTEHAGCHVHDALARGYKMGFIASGDHNAMGIGLAAVWVKEVSRKGIMEALRARRCYGTTGDGIFLDFRVNGRMMGEEIACSEKPRVTAEVDGTTAITNAVLFTNNQVVLERTESDLDGSSRLRLDFTDPDFSADSYYYLRVIQANKEIAWSSPIWVSRS